MSCLSFSELSTFSNIFLCTGRKFMYIHTNVKITRLYAEFTVSRSHRGVGQRLHHQITHSYWRIFHETLHRNVKPNQLVCWYIIYICVCVHSVSVHQCSVSPHSWVNRVPVITSSVWNTFHEYTLHDPVAH